MHLQVQTAFWTTIDSNAWTSRAFLMHILLASETLTLERLPPQEDCTEYVWTTLRGRLITGLKSSS